MFIENEEVDSAIASWFKADDESDDLLTLLEPHAECWWVTDPDPGDYTFFDIFESGIALGKAANGKDILRVNVPDESLVFFFVGTESIIVKNILNVLTSGK